jgi:hypothetical protein
MLDPHGHFWLLDQDRERLLERRALERAARSGRPHGSWFARSGIGRLNRAWRLASAARSRVRSRRVNGGPAPTGPLPF